MRFIPFVFISIKELNLEDFFENLFLFIEIANENDNCSMKTKSKEEKQKKNALFFGIFRLFSQNFIFRCQLDTIDFVPKQQQYAPNAYDRQAHLLNQVQHLVHAVPKSMMCIVWLQPIKFEWQPIEFSVIERKMIRNKK